MNSLNYEFSFLNSPYHESLINSLIDISTQKRKLASRLKSEDDYFNKLTYEERSAYQYLSQEENRILLEIITVKGWFNSNSEHISYSGEVVNF